MNRLAKLLLASVLLLVSVGSGCIIRTDTCCITDRQTEELAKMTAERIVELQDQRDDDRHDMN